MKSWVDNVEGKQGLVTQKFLEPEEKLHLHSCCAWPGFPQTQQIAFSFTNLGFFLIFNLIIWGYAFVWFKSLTFSLVSSASNSYKNFENLKFLSHCKVFWIIPSYFLFKYLNSWNFRYVSSNILSRILISLYILNNLDANRLIVSFAPILHYIGLVKIFICWARESGQWLSFNLLHASIGFSQPSVIRLWLMSTFK